VGYIPDEKIAEIQQATDIVKLISEYLPLKRAGSSYKALCPFHREKTPSFMVNPARQIFKCFGCGEGGDVFKFIMKQERVDFVEAVKILARRAGIEVTEVEGGTGTSERTRLYEANEWAAKFYHRFLVKEAGGSKAREYLRGRKIGDRMIKEFLLGFAPNARDGLIRAAAKEGVDAALLEKAGLLARREDGSPYDRFRNRVMFPIFDARGRVLGFGGRTLGDSDVKYINTPETPIFTKGHLLYGLNLARDEMVKSRRAVVVEGYTDVIMAHQFGMRNVVAVLGTALGREHVRLLRRYADEVILVFDSDTAGQRSSDRSLEIFLEEETPVRIAALPAGSDPCDYLLENGREAFERCIEGADDLISFKMKITLPEGEARSTAEVARAIDEILTTIAASPNPAHRDLMLRAVAGATGVSEVSLKSRLGSISKRGRRAGAEWDGTAASDEERAEQRAQKQILQSVMARCDLAEHLEEAKELFTDPVLRAAAERLFDLYREKGEFTEAEALAHAGDERVRDVLTRFVGADMAEDGFDYEEQLRGAVRFLKWHRVRRQAEEAREKLLMAKRAGSEQDQLKWLAEFAQRKRELERFRLTQKSV